MSMLCRVRRGSGVTGSGIAGASRDTAIRTDQPLDVVEQPSGQTTSKTKFRRLRPLGALLASPYRELPPMPRGRWPRIALALVTVLALAFVVYYTAYTWSLLDTFRSNAEDMGIMDQALWNTLHGAVLHQTICNSISDTNCLGDVSRFAIHFEPIMLPLSLLYVFAPTPKALMLLQTLVVASGVFPVFWIACRRLSSPLAGGIFAAAYLLYPQLQSAVLFDFHAVTLTMAFLVFALYFMLTRNNVGLLIACVLALSTKEEVPLDIVMIGLAILFFQRRWKLGAGVIGLSLAWLAVAVIVMHIASPVGHSPTAARYGYLGDSPIQAGIYVVTHPLQVLREEMLDDAGISYMGILLGAFSFLGFASPLTLILCLPALSINLLSSDANMHQGLHQYSAEIVPIMVFSAISGIALLLEFVALGQRRYILAPDAFSNLRKQVGYVFTRLRLKTPTVSRVALVTLLAIAFAGCLVQQRTMNLGNPPTFLALAWPTATPHSDLANTVVAMIPANASVSAQNTLVPHLSHRRSIYQYPYSADQSDYVVLDTSGFIYPFTDQHAYDQSVRDLQSSGHFRTVFAQDGYLVLQRATPGP